jgi:hypothetical protein
MKTRIFAASLLSLAAAGFAGAGTTDGSCLEPWALENFQPLSPTHGQIVESSSYFPRTTVVMLLVAS